MRDIRRIDLNLLVALDALLEEQSVTRAADRLALTQPTVSAMLARLRKLFGDPLFVRTQRGILPTPRAAALAPVLKQWLAEARGLIADAGFDPATDELTAAISANDYIQSTLLVPYFRRLRREAPNARLAVRSPQFSDMAAMLADAEIDLIITTTPYPHAMVSPTEGRFVGPVDRALAEVGRRRRVVLAAPGFLVLPEVLKTDDLIAVVPERVLCGRMGGLRTFAPPVAVPGFDVVMLWHERLHKDPAHRWLRELLAAVAEDLRRAPVVIARRKS